MSTPRAAQERTIWLYKKQLLVGKLTNTPGRVEKTREAPGDPPVTCPFASGQCLSAEWEDDILKGLSETNTWEELLRRMKYFKYRVETEAPRFRRRPYTRL